MAAAENQENLRLPCSLQGVLATSLLLLRRPSVSRQRSPCLVCLRVSAWVADCEPTSPERSGSGAFPSVGRARRTARRPSRRPACD